jgi:hypothetical protein
MASLILLIICSPSLAQNSFTTQRAVVFYHSDEDLNAMDAPSLTQNSFATQRAVVFYQSKDDLNAMDRRLDFTPCESFYQAYFIAWPVNQNPIAPRLAAKIDGLLDKVCRILHLWPSNNTPLQIRLLKDARTLWQYQLAYQDVKNKPLFGHSPMEAFYQPLTQTIYLSLTNLRTGILAHEMAHFVLCTAFQSPPPSDIQEDLATFVETRLE